MQTKLTASKYLLEENYGIYEKTAMKRKPKALVLGQKEQLRGSAYVF